eukprot:15226155-Alexandrium_andersonii.AAC.1
MPRPEMEARWAPRKRGPADDAQNEDDAFCQLLDGLRLSSSGFRRSQPVAGDDIDHPVTSRVGFTWFEVASRRGL